ncbi:MAG: hypothetical protein K2Y22_03845 [Candidatus Obscuribacterales bacterium]|nr:hypothetical protein [Candidatus Obscuribacterales bacterium]
MNTANSVKISLLLVILVPLFSVPVDAAPVVVRTHPITGRPIHHRIGRFGVASHRIGHPVTSIESRIGTPAQAVNILNSTLTNRIDNRSVVEHAYLNSINERLTIERLAPSFSSRQESGKNDLLTGKDRNLRTDIHSKEAAKNIAKSVESTLGTALAGNAGQSSGTTSADGGNSTTAAGDGSGGSMGYSGDTPDELSQERTRIDGDKIHMGQGSVLVSYENKISVQTRLAEIRLAPLACVFIVQFGDDVAIYNLGDNHKGDVTVVLNNKESLAVPFGHQLVLSAQQSEFAKANPSEKIQCDKVHHLGRRQGVHVFDATYSPISALDNAPQLDSLLTSESPQDKQTMNRMFKSMAALLAVQ